VTPRAEVFKAADRRWYGEHGPDCDRRGMVYDPLRLVYQCLECGAAFAADRRQESAPMPVTLENLEQTMTYHRLDGEQQAAYNRIERAAIAFARVALEVLPACGDQQAAIRSIFEAKATLNRGVAVRGIV
jgi:hypothetical protein